jgi:excisionase family DNA binding protein
MITRSGITHDDGRYISLGEAARYTTLSVGTLRRLLREGKLLGYRPSGRRVLIDRDELDAFVRAAADK